VKLHVVAMGQRMPGWVTSACADYADRLPRDFAFALTELKPEARDRGKTAAQLLSAEAPRIRAACRGHAMVALDERGQAWTTRAFAEHIGRWRDTSTNVAFVIGSADGLDASLKAEAAANLALSAMTLPHALARVVLIEQIYRAVSLLTGHPYHRD
jgi:23S rRNA (pseudouridine1915-N3)-methyltransferase